LWTIYVIDPIIYLSALLVIKIIKGRTNLLLIFHSIVVAQWLTADIKPTFKHQWEEND